MALNIVQKFSIDLSGVVENSITAVKAVRRSEQTRKESEFQRAVANGLSYEEQLTMREKWLEEEKKSPVADTEYINVLEKSIADTKKLNRFNSYRTRYAESLGELSAGKINEEQYLSTLKSQLNGITDPELRLEIQGDIATAEGRVKTYRDTILSNQVKRLKYDGTKASLSEAVARVSAARAQALINNNEDEVTAYDETLSALNSQLSAVRIQDSITDFQVNNSVKGTNPVDKLNYINSQVQNSDPNIVVKIGDKTYTSAQQFWSLERDNFLAGTSQIFGDFFKELDTHAKGVIDVNASKFGYPTQTILDDVFGTFKELRARPEMTPFLSHLDTTQATIMSNAVDKLAKTINDVGTNNLTFQEADIQLQNISTRYGIDVSGYRLQLDEQLRNLARSGVINESEATALAPDVNIPLPKVGETPVKTETPATVTPEAPVAGARVIKTGDTLSGIAKESGIGLSQLLELNPQFKANPNIIRPGQTVNLPSKPSEATAPTPTPTTSPPTPTTIQPPTPTTAVVPPATTTTPPKTPKPTTYTIKSGDTLSGIALNLLGDASRYKEIAELNKIVDPNKIQSGATINIPL